MFCLKGDNFWRSFESRMFKEERLVLFQWPLLVMQKMRSKQSVVLRNWQVLQKLARLSSCF